MKNNYYLILCIFILIPSFSYSQDFSAQVDYYFQHLDKSEIPTSILYERVFPAVDLKKLTDAEIDTTSVMHFLTAFAELQTADYTGRWQPASTIINDLADKPYWEVPVGVINIDYNSIDERAITDNLLDITIFQGDSLLVDVPNRSRSPYLLHTATLASPLKSYSNSLTPSFYWEATRQDSQNNIVQVEVDFNLGNGWQNLSSVVTPSFPNYGTYYIDFKITLSNGIVKINRASFEIIEGSSTATIQQKTQNFTSGNCLETQGEFYATRPFQGYDESEPAYGKGEYEIVQGGSEIDRLVVVVDGFDPEEGTEGGNDLDGIYADFNQQGLANSLRLNEGFDIVPLNFKKQVYFNQGSFLYPRVINGGTDYIERNAMVLITLLEKLNTCKGDQPIKVVGFSMGGLIARYALAFMEQHNIDHNVDLFVSVDSPHQGAVLPKGLQDAADLVADLTLNIVNGPKGMLQSPAARQLLKHHISSSSALPQGAPNFHDHFFNIIDQLGYPQDSRNISVINGTLDGSAINGPGQQYADLSANIALLGNLKGKLKLNYSPEPGNTINNLYFRLYYRFTFFNFTIYKRERSVSSLSSFGSLENAPGGYFPVDQETDNFFEGWFYGAFGDTSPSVLEKYLQDVLGSIRVNLNNPNFSFVPSKSSLDFIGDPYLYERINDRDLTCSGETPFDTYYAPSESQKHIYLGIGAAEFIKQEINGNEQKPNLDINSSENLSGPEVVCYNTATFNFDACAGTVSGWSVSSNLNILSSTNYSVTVQPTNAFVSGQGFIDAVLPSGSIRRNIWVGQPRVVAKLSSGEYLAHGSVNNTVCRNEQITTNMDIDGATNSTWSMISSSHTVTWSQQGNNISFYLWAVGHTATFRFTTSNECGSITRDFKFVSEDCSGGGDDPCEISYTVSPTLAEDEIEINFIPPPCDPPVIESNTTTLGVVEDSKATLYDFSGNPVIIRTPASGKMNVEKLNPGHYILVISNNGKEKSHRIIIN